MTTSNIEPILHNPRPPEPGTSHYIFFRELQAGGRIWRDDPSNNKKEWIKLDHPSIAGNAARIQEFGCNDLQIKSAPEDREPLRRRLSGEQVDDMIVSFQNPKKVRSEETINLLEALKKTTPAELVRVFNINPELREATNRSIDTETFQQMKRAFPGGAVIAHFTHESPNKNIEELDREIDKMIEKLPTLKFFNLLKAIPFFNDGQKEKCCLREPIAALQLGCDYLPSKIFIPAYNAAKEGLFVHQENKERSAIFVLQEIAEHHGMTIAELSMPDKNKVLTTHEEKVACIQNDPGQAILSHIAAENANHLKLTAEELTECALRRPDVALKVSCLIKEKPFREGVSAKTFDKCAMTNTKTKDIALKIATSSLTKTGLLKCAKSRPKTTLAILTKGRASKHLLHTLYTVCDQLPTSLQTATREAVTAFLQPKKNKEKEPEK